MLAYLQCLSCIELPVLKAAWKTLHSVIQQVCTIAHDRKYLHLLCSHDHYHLAGPLGFGNGALAT